MPLMEKMLNFWQTALSYWQHTLIFIVVALIFFNGGAIWEWFRAAMDAKPPATHEEASTILRNFGLIFVGGYGIYLADRRLKSIDRQHALDKRSELFDRFQRSSAMLDSPNQALRQAGIHVLAEIAKEEPIEFFDRVTNLLCSFLRQASDEQRELAKEIDIYELPVPATSPVWPKQRADMIEAIQQLSVLRSGVVMGEFEGGTLDVVVDLQGLFVPGFNLSNILFYKCNLSGAVFADTAQSEVVFMNCPMHSAIFYRARLRGCVFQYCKAEIINFNWCFIAHTILLGVKFHSAVFEKGYVDAKTLETAEKDLFDELHAPSFTDPEAYESALIYQQEQEAFHATTWDARE